MGLDDLFIKNLIEGTMILSEVPSDRQYYIKCKLEDMVNNKELDRETYNSIIYNILVNPDILIKDNKEPEIVDMDLNSFSLQSSDD